MAAKILREFSSLADAQPEAASSTERVIQREIEVLELVAEGQTNHQVAETPCLAENTVKDHLRIIAAKLHLKNRAQAAACMVREGLVDTSGK